MPHHSPTAPMQPIELTTFQLTAFQLTTSRLMTSRLMTVHVHTSPKPPLTPAPAKR